MIRISNFSVREFEELLKHRTEVICVGAGRIFQRLCLSYIELENCVACVLDNFKTGTIRIGNREVPVMSLDQYKKRENAIFIVTTMIYADELIRQMNSLPDYDGATVCFPILFTEEDAEPLERFAHGSEQLIPKTIHYCWFGGGPIPEKFRANIETWKKYCPDYEIICWNEDNYDVTKNRYMKQAYEAKVWGFVPDYARLDIIHTYGGIYLDTDVELLKPLDDLLNFKAFCGFEKREYVGLGLGFGSQKSNPILRDMMAVYDKLDFINPDGSLNLTASPIYQTEVLENYGLVRNGQTQVVKDFLVLSRQFLCPVDLYRIGRPSIHSYSIHQFAGTWGSDEDITKNDRAIQNCKYILAQLRQA